MGTIISELQKLLCELSHPWGPAHFLYQKFSLLLVLLLGAPGLARPSRRQLDLSGLKLGLSC